MIARARGDADTIWIDGTKYRVHGIDTPEKGDKAKCDQERARAAIANAYIETITQDAVLSVTREYGPDRYGRTVADISINGRDWAEWLVADGFAQRWDYDGGEPRPTWCKE